MTITLTEQDGKTHLKWRCLFETKKVCDNVKKYAVGVNEENIDRLKNELTLML